MKYRLLWILTSMFLFLQCGLINSKKQSENLKSEVIQPKTPEQIAALEKQRQDSIETAAYEQMQKTAFGELRFGMEKEQVEKLNEKRQKLGNYDYNFSHSFNGDNQLYKVKIASDGIKAIQFDSGLKNNYNNLFQIIKTKYGIPNSSVTYPSVFDVQNSKKIQLNQWELGSKQINLGLQENKMNSFSVYCEIQDKTMAEFEKQRLSDLKNKNLIRASEKF